MKWLVVLLVLVNYALPAHAAAPPEVMAALKASSFADATFPESRTELLGKIRAGKRTFWVVTNETDGLKNDKGKAIRSFCTLVFLEGEPPSYLGFYGSECEKFRVRGQRVEYWAPKPDGAPRWLGFTLTEKGPPPGLYDSPEFFPFRK